MEVIPFLHLILFIDIDKKKGRHQVENLKYWQDMDYDLQKNKQTSLSPKMQKNLQYLKDDSRFYL